MNVIVLEYVLECLGYLPVYQVKFSRCIPIISLYLFPINPSFSRVLFLQSIFTHTLAICLLRILAIEPLESID